MEMHSNNSHRPRQQEETYEQLHYGFAPDENKKAISEERDVDDLIHIIPVSSVKTGTEIDPDDAIHQKPPLRPERSGMADPDDLVHGG